MLKSRRTRKIIAAILLLIFTTNTFAPLRAYALTGGPTAPEATSFEPVDTTDMVNLVTGDLTYNIPLLEVPGPEAYRGSAIEKSFLNQTKTNPIFKFANKRGWVQMGSRTKGPDIIGGGPLKGKWIDITTKADWGRHVAKYQGANATKGVDWGKGLNWAVY